MVIFQYVHFAEYKLFDTIRIHCKRSLYSCSGEFNEIRKNEAKQKNQIEMVTQPMERFVKIRQNDYS